MKSLTLQHPDFILSLIEVFVNLSLSSIEYQISEKGIPSVETLDPLAVWLSNQRPITGFVVSISTS